MPCTQRFRLHAVLASCLLLLASAQADPLRYVKRATARESYQASLEAQKTTGVVLGPWFAIGPFDNTGGKGFETAYPPEKGIDLAATYQGKGDKPVRWIKGEKLVDGKPNDLHIFSDNDHVAVYLCRTITSDGEQGMPVLFGSDDTLTVWLNGEKVFARNVTRACVLEDRLVLKLRPGRNDLLLKVCNGDGGFGFAFGDASQFAPAEAEAWLLGRIAEDFPDEAHGMLVEADWFRQDKLGEARADFAKAAAGALALARATLDFVQQRAPRPALAAELEALAARHAAAGPDADWRALYLQTRWLRRRIALADPLLDFGRLLINKRPPPLYSHMCDQYLGRHSRPGPGLCTLENWKATPKATPLLEGKLPEGSVLHPDLSFDARRVLFSFCDHTEKSRDRRLFHIWEAAADGSSVAQLTFEPNDGALARSVNIEDFDPCYLPGGGFVFVSTRNQGYGRCHGGRYTPSYVLYRAEADGSSIRRTSWGEANEWDPSVLADGRLIYTRWDYINRHDTLFQSLWTTRPDGSGVALFYGNATANPCMTAEARAIPGSRKVVSTATAHHSYTAGSIFTVDPDEGEEGKDPIRRITPESRFPETEGYSEGVYATPWPLSEDLFLAAFNPDRHIGQGSVARANAYAIYLVDSYGGRELLYRDPATSCFTPIPLRPRPEPPAIPTVVQADQTEGVFSILDVYRCTEPLEPGSIKRLRVVNIFQQPTASVPVRSRVDNEVVKGIVGTVPVNADGSVAFIAPAEQPLLFQLLDENNMAVMSMRSQAYLQPGERASCIGCHEPRNDAPPPSFGQAPVRRLEPSPGPPSDRGFSFARTVQPVLDRYCIRCHGLGKPEAAGAAAAEPAGGKDPKKKAEAPLPPLDLLGTPTGSFSAAYDSLVARRDLVKLAHRNGERPYTTPNLYGARGGRLAALLLGDDHRKHVELDRDSFTRIAEWLDLNGQYYGDYLHQRPERRKPSDRGIAALREHLKAACARCHADLPEQPLAALVNIALPDESRVLQAPLARSAGGWGQCREAWPDPSAAGYRELRARVLEAAGPADPSQGRFARR